MEIQGKTVLVTGASSGIGSVPVLPRGEFLGEADPLASRRAGTRARDRLAETALVLALLVSLLSAIGLTKQASAAADEIGAAEGRQTPSRPVCRPAFPI